MNSLIWRRVLMQDVWKEFRMQAEDEEEEEEKEESETEEYTN